MMSRLSCSIRRFVSLIAVSARSFEQPTPTSLQRMTVDRGARPAVARLVRVLRLAACELRHRRDDAGEVLVVERAERALAVRQDGDLDRRAADVRAVAVAATSAAATDDERCERNELPPALESIHSDALLLSNRLDVCENIWGVRLARHEPVCGGSAPPFRHWAPPARRRSGSDPSDRGAARDERRAARSQRPMRPPGETSTMTRKIAPISVCEARPDEADLLRVVVEDRRRRARRPRRPRAGRGRRSTAITSTSIVAPRSIDAGSMWPFHQTKRTPPIAAMNDAKRERDRAVQRDVVAERRHPHRVVAHALQRQAERRPRRCSAAAA